MQESPKPPVLAMLHLLGEPVILLGPYFFLFGANPLVPMTVDLPIHPIRVCQYKFSRRCNNPSSSRA